MKLFPSEFIQVHVVQSSGTRVMALRKTSIMAVTPYTEDKRKKIGSIIMLLPGETHAYNVRESYAEVIRELV